MSAATLRDFQRCAPLQYGILPSAKVTVKIGSSYPLSQAHFVCPSGRVRRLVLACQAPMAIWQTLGALLAV